MLLAGGFASYELIQVGYEPRDELARETNDEDWGDLITMRMSERDRKQGWLHEEDNLAERVHWRGKVGSG